MSSHERVQILKAAEPNSWIAFSHDETSVVATAGSYLEAVNGAEERGETDPVLVHVPDEWLPLVL